MEPVMDADGRMEGYRLSPRSRRAWFDGLGLIPGDLLVAVNGVTFDPDNMARARREMSAGNDMMLTILRDGEQLEITVGSANFGLLAM
jgi:type II secretion system protein C